MSDTNHHNLSVTPQTDLTDNAGPSGRIECIEELQKSQRDIDALGIKELEEILAIIKPIERSSKLAKKPFFEKRKEAISQIPQFWTTALRNCTKFFFFSTDEDVNFLQYLENFTTEGIEEESQSGFKLYFYFKDNPFIKDKVLSKAILWASNGERMSTTTPIDWKDDQNPSEETTNIKFLDWLSKNEDPLSFNFMQLLELWENPLQYYLMDDSDEFHTTKQVESSAEALKMIEECQEQIQLLNRKVDEEMLKVTASVGKDHEEENKRLFRKRNEIIANIPHFWLIALCKHPQLSVTIDEEEIDCLYYLTGIDVEHSEKLEPSNQKSSMTIHFYFAEDNPFMENTVLSKEYLRGDDGEKTCNSNPIIWKTGKQISREEGEVDKERTFFDWFVDNTDPESNSHITLPILQLWEDPVQYYLLPDVCSCQSEKEISEEPQSDVGLCIESSV